ncbi:MAG: M20/M25/M40 family metallo-hydrolase, partial [Bacteroidetes bacterium]|nr:M20/M25/M40 family metallo-hydrolase [Bacteroidota bacterium]
AARRADKPTLLLCSHHDTVKPSKGYTRDPYKPLTQEGRLYGLGSNDAGGALVCLTQAFIRLHQLQGTYNLLLVLSAEEEVSGSGGLAMVLPQLPPIDAALIGEPTGMQAAIGERGLMVLEGETVGVSGHAARGEGINAIYQALKDIDTLKHFSFEKISPTMGNVRLQVTQIEGGTQHNVVPDRCRFVVDVRTTDAYTNQEILALLQQRVQSTLTPRSLNHTASATPADSPLRKAIHALHIPTYISPTSSDWIQLSCPALKIGPGDSKRSHTADEYILISELEEGLKGYLRLLNTLQTHNL